MIQYPTRIEHHTFGDKFFVLEVIRDLDEAIEILCDHLGPHPDPFAEDQCPYYGILWPSARALAGYVSAHETELKGKPILEIGCGLALPSMVASHYKLNVTASDFHPDVGAFLARNLRHNSLELKYHRMNWREENPGLELFDVVMGSDVLYEPKHPGDVARGFMRLLKPGGEVWLADPGRGYLQRFVDEMNALGFKHSLEPQVVDENEIYLFRFYRA